MALALAMALAMALALANFNMYQINSEGRMEKLISVAEEDADLIDALLDEKLGHKNMLEDVRLELDRLNNLLDTPEAQDDKNRARLKMEIRRVTKIEQSLKKKIKALSHREIASKFEHVEKHQVDRMAYKKIKIEDKGRYKDVFKNVQV